jgi:hypothetical protein
MYVCILYYYLMTFHCISDPKPKPHPPRYAKIYYFSRILYALILPFNFNSPFTICLSSFFRHNWGRSVLNHGEGVCADPGKRDATLGVGGLGPPERGSEQQLVPDSGGGKT